MLWREACLLFVTLGLAVASDVCYDDLGCFTTKAPFGGTVPRPISILPQPPTKIKTQFFVYTRENMNTYHELNHTSIAANNIGQFKATRPTKFIIEGFLQSLNTAWVGLMKNALLAKGDFNVIVVDWSNGNQFPYTQATANAQVVGAEIARLLNALIEHADLDLSDVHLIGHSLGAHSAGYAGKIVRTIGRITGLDPAEPYFQYAEPAVRLDSTDARLVDVIHTDADPYMMCGWGMIQPIGHLDFYPNGGTHQPGCPNGISKLTNSFLSMMTFNVGGVESALTCSHSRAHEYFIETIKSSCSFTAFPCNSQSDFEAGNCFTCAGGVCPRMGYNADQVASRNGSFQLMTGLSAPFCRYYYFVTVKTTSGTNSRGIVQIKLTGSAGTSDFFDLFKTDTAINPSTSYSVVFASPVDLGTILNTKIKFRKVNSMMSIMTLTWWLVDSNIGIKSVKVLAADSQQNYELCAASNKIQSDETNTYTPC